VCACACAFACACACVYAGAKYLARNLGPVLPTQLR